MDEQLGLRSTSGQEIAFCGATVEAHLAGLLAQTVIEQRYANSTTENLEITYTFALPVDAVLLGFEVEIGEKKLLGNVVPRAEAEERYESAVEGGNSAFRLTLLRIGLYAAALGNLMSGETATLRLRYAEPLRQVSGRLRYRLPTTISPRYGSPQDLPAWFAPQSDLQAAYGFEAVVRLEGELSKARFMCPTHRVACEPAPGRVTLTVASAQMDRDFVLDIEPQRSEAIAVGGRASDAAGEFIVMASFLPPNRSLAGVQREVVVVLDCSGSMAGDSIAHAKEGVLLALASLSPNDHVGLIRFGNEVQAFEPRLLQADQPTLQRARDWVNQTDANLGGTELAKALNVAMRLSGGAQKRGGRDILLLTDGEAWDVSEVAEHAMESNVRIFTVGIGPAVAEDTVRMLADETDGACEMVTPDETMSHRIAAHFARMRQVPISAVEIDWGVAPHWEVRPDRALFAGDAFVVYAALPSEPRSVQTMLQYADGTEGACSTSLEAVVALEDAVVRCAAAARLKELPPAARCSWAVQHQLISSDTDYIVVLERAAHEKAHNLPALQQTPQMLSAGWGGTGSVRSPAAIAACYGTSFSDVDCSFDDEAPTRNQRVLRSVRRMVREDVVPTVTDAIRKTGSAVSAATQALQPIDASLLSEIVLHCEGEPSQLPATIDDLIALGLDPALVSVLRGLVGDLGVQEPEVVRAYLIILAREATPGTDESHLLIWLANGTAKDDLLSAVEDAVNKARGLKGSIRQIRNAARRLADNPFDFLRRFK